MAHRVQTNKPLVDLPGVGRVELTGQAVTLTDEQYSMIPASAFTGGGSALLIDLGVVGPSGDLVTTQGTHVANASAATSGAPSALTSSQNATATAVDLTTSEALANALKTNYNALQVDVAALRTNQAAIAVDVAAMITKVNAILTALQVAGGPMSTT